MVYDVLCLSWFFWTHLFHSRTQIKLGIKCDCLGPKRTQEERSAYVVFVSSVGPVSHESPAFSWHDPFALPEPIPRVRALKDGPSACLALDSVRICFWILVMNVVRPFLLW